VWQMTNRKETVCVCMYLYVKLVHNDIILEKYRFRTKFGKRQKESEKGNISTDTEIFPFHGVLCTTVEFTKE